MEKIKIGLMGDVMIGRGVNQVLKGEEDTYPWGDVLPWLKGTSFNLINLESPLTKSRDKVTKTYNFKADPDMVRVLQTANVRVACLANNHILDFNTGGLVETIETLNGAGILHIGAGKDNIEASVPAILSVDGVQVGILGFTDNEPLWKAAGNKPGVNYINLFDQQSRINALNEISQLRAYSDTVIVSIHWGANMGAKPSATFVDFAHEMIDHGAGIIHGHSAHILQGIELYHGKAIFYDTGDFIDDYAVDPEFRNDLSALFIVELEKNEVTTIKIVPTRISDCQVNLAVNEDQEWVINHLQDLSAELDTFISSGEKMKV